MKVAQYMILATIFLLSYGAREVKGQISEDLLKVRDEVEIGIHIGERAPDLVFESPAGEKISLSSLRGQMVLIDFWAAWYGPCRRENPNLVNTYHQYKDKEFVNGSGFTIYSVSLDQSKESWVAAIEKDSLEWESHVSDLKGRKSAPAIEYEVESIPVNFLLDGNGIILAVGLRGHYLEDRLKELLK